MWRGLRPRASVHTSRYRQASLRKIRARSWWAGSRCTATDGTFTSSDSARLSGRPFRRQGICRRQEAHPRGFPRCEWSPTHSE